MKNESVSELDRAKGKMIVDLRTMIADSEELLKAVTTASDEGFTGMRTKFEEKMRNAKHALADMSQPVFDRTKASAAAANDYVHNNPWTVIGVGVAAGVLAGLLTAKRKH